MKQICDCCRKKAGYVLRDNNPPRFEGVCDACLKIESITSEKNWILKDLPDCENCKLLNERIKRLEKLLHSKKNRGAL